MPLGRITNDAIQPFTTHNFSLCGACDRMTDGLPHSEETELWRDRRDGGIWSGQQLIVLRAGLTFSLTNNEETWDRIKVNAMLGSCSEFCASHEIGAKVSNGNSDVMGH